MKRKITKLISKCIYPLLKPMEQRIDQQTEAVRVTGRAAMQTRAMLKRSIHEKINVIFVCHSPSLWGKLSPVYRALNEDPNFKVSLVAVPYKHSSFSSKEYHDDGMGDYLRHVEGVDPVIGYNKDKNKWLDLQLLEPDYVFFQTPYDSIFPPTYTSEYISAYARICYVPYYGIMIYKGSVDETTHPISFFKNVSLVFVGHQIEAKELVTRFHGIWSSNQVIMAGAPMLDYVIQKRSLTNGAWNNEKVKGRMRILWTPRWHTGEGNCHFFDYKDYFIGLAKSGASIDLLFRPHPLCFRNFLKTGELNEHEYQSMLKDYEQLPNAAIDTSGAYEDTFLSSDILVSDMSSMIAEYFITGKPIVYTHRVDTFNEFGSKLAKGFYWVKNQLELDEVLSMLRRGEDPLKSKRQAIIEEMFYIPNNGSACVIKNTLQELF
jgi:hypothetical protein